MSEATDASGRVLLRALFADTSLYFVSAAYRTRDGALLRPLSQVAILYRAGTSPAQRDSFERANRLRLIRSPNPGRGAFDTDYQLPPRIADPFAFSQKLAQAAFVEYADPNMVGGIRQLATPSDPFYSLQYYLKNSFLSAGGIPVDIAVERVWDFTRGYRGGLGVQIAVLDDGVQGWHSDFSGSTVTVGYDAVGDCSTCPRDPQLVTGAPLNGFSHGTAVAGIIGATHNNGLGIAGIAPEAVIVPVRIFDSNGTAVDNLRIRDAINWAWSVQQVDVLNNSWGAPATGPNSQAVEAAIANASTLGRGGLGTPAVFSAGNVGNRNVAPPGAVFWPARTVNAISASAIDAQGAPASYAPRGKIDLVAPSSSYVGPCFGDVVTIDRMSTPGCNDGPGGNIDFNSTFGGTSAAAPQVSAVIALLLAREPSLSLSTIRSRLSSGADSWGRADDFGAGKLNATFTVLPLAATISGPTVVTAPGTYSWSSAASGGSGVYSYAWHYRNQGVAQWTFLSSSSSASRTVPSNAPRFQIRLVVTSVWRTVSTYYDVAIDAP